jgi:hypothetical protein
MKEALELGEGVMELSVDVGVLEGLAVFGLEFDARFVGTGLCNGFKELRKG